MFKMDQNGLCFIYFNISHNHFYQKIEINNKMQWLHHLLAKQPINIVQIAHTQVRNPGTDNVQRDIFPLSLNKLGREYACMKKHGINLDLIISYMPLHHLFFISSLLAWLQAEHVLIPMYKRWIINPSYWTCFLIVSATQITNPDLKTFLQKSGLLVNTYQCLVSSQVFGFVYPSL